MQEQTIGESLARETTHLLGKTEVVEIDFNNYIDPTLIPEEHKNLKNFNVVARINLGPSEEQENQQSLYIVDARDMSNVTTDFLLVDEKFDHNFLGRGITHSTPHAALGYKGIHEDEPIKVGRNHHTGKDDKRFDYAPHVSRDHLEISYDGKKLEIKNTNPGNDTLVTAFFANSGKPPRSQSNDPNMTLETHPDNSPSQIGALAIAGDQVENASKEILKDSRIGLISEAKGYEQNQDSYLIDAENGIFGIFDGMGGYKGGAEASRLASETFRRLMSQAVDVNQSPQAQLDLLKRAFDEAHKKVEDYNATNRMEAGTTGTVAIVIDNDEGKWMAWGSVGDSRLYLRGPNGKLVPISKDEGYQNVIDNAIGVRGYKLKQFGVVKVPEGSQVILMSDGINGDYEYDIPDEYIEKNTVSDAEFNEVLKGISDHQEVANKLRRISLKRDDKTVIVVGDLNST